MVCWKGKVNRMSKYFRLLIVVILLVGIVILAGGKVAWAGQSAAEQPSNTAQGRSLAGQAKPGSCKGTACPPPDTITICANGIHSVGGVSTIEVTELEPGYCLDAFLHNKAFALGRIPDGAGQVLANATFMQVYHNSRFVYDIPTTDGVVEICYAVPPTVTSAQIYFFDFYGPRFGMRTGQPSWEPLQTTVTDGVACAAAQTSGAYALIGQ